MGHADLQGKKLLVYGLHLGGFSSVQGSMDEVEHKLLMLFFKLL